VIDEAVIAAAVRALPMPAYRQGQGLQARNEAITAEAVRTGLTPTRVAEIWHHGFDCDLVLAEMRRMVAEQTGAT
jgi:hypothetical protein